MGNKSSRFIYPYDQFTGKVRLEYFDHEVEDVDGSKYSLRRLPFEAVPDLCDYASKEPSTTHFNTYSKHWFRTLIKTDLPNSELYFLCAQVDPFVNPGFTEADMPRPVKGKLPRLELQQLQARSFRSVVQLDAQGEGVNANKGSPDYSKYPNPSYHVLLFYYYDAQDTVHAMHTTAIHLSSDDNGPDNGIEEAFGTASPPKTPNGSSEFKVPGVTPSTRTLNSQKSKIERLPSKTSTGTSMSSASSSSPKLGKRDKIRKIFRHVSGISASGSPKTGKRERLMGLLPGDSSSDPITSACGQNATDRPPPKAILNCRAKMLHSSPLFTNMPTAGTWDLQRDREVGTDEEEAETHLEAIAIQKSIAQDYTARLQLSTRHKVLYYAVIAVQCVALLYLAGLYATQLSRLSKLGAYYVIPSS
ncbi:hypothetical protein SARC_02804 [Sphaeroforma arctica JP610]|uniref:Uncharacterized protein n=1 Tax=Sphaeroforma arctica JP610 TaxID=667725 RepID=A0A0L0G9P2_9EUKA|nr:hypothetical protein SARC_02804 [Sphaeroforma arctica JP610]KNC84983.1 hypothetical protein SARC_02804 [Sphaeroforma arctica JP610]|eukprot:XP_014158885.1 hypothetical protein SARC_02804 [Sphaeroforma arctica JP610]